MAVSFKTGGSLSCWDGGMNTKKTPDIAAAERFLAGHARVVDRRALERLFQGGAAQPVKDAVAAYRNADGGFGHALEPDCRASASQPAAVGMALRLLDIGRRLGRRHGAGRL